MSDDTKPIDTGHTELAVGAGLGVYMLGTAATLGSVCSICVLAMPAFLAWGGVKKYRSLHQKPDHAEMAEE